MSDSSASSSRDKGSAEKPTKHNESPRPLKTTAGARSWTYYVGVHVRRLQAPVAKALILALICLAGTLSPLGHATYSLHTIGSSTMSVDASVPCSCH